MPIPKKPLSEEIQAKVTKKYVNLQALFYNADPFDESWDEQLNDVDKVF